MSEITKTGHGQYSVDLVNNDAMVSEWPEVTFPVLPKYRCEAGHETESVLSTIFRGPDGPPRVYAFCYECRAAWFAKQWPVKRVDDT